MNCTCIDMDVNDYSEVLSDIMPTARKEHRCIECNRAIHIGEKYRKENTIYDGRFETYKTCIDCNSIRNEFICGGWYWGEILEAVAEIENKLGQLAQQARNIEAVGNNIHDCGADISESAIAELTKPARERICEMIEEYWDWDEGLC